MTEHTESEVRPQTWARRRGPKLLAALALMGLFALLLDLAGRLRPPIIIDIGPSTGRYASGFEDSEETPPTTSRWTRQNAEFEIPLDVDASMVRFSLRAARYVDEPTQVRVSVNGRAFLSFEQPRGRQRIQEFEAPLPPGPLKLGFVSEDKELGMALDWIRIEGARFRIQVDEWTVWILPVGIFGALLLAGAALNTAALATTLILAAMALVAALDPFGFVHSMRDVAVPAVALSMIAALAFRGQTALVLAVTASVLLKGGFLFHPSYFYNDVRQNDRYVGALSSYEGSIMERSRKAQVDLGVGYPRIIAGKKYAFPYSPIFYLPFTALPPDRDVVVRAIKHVALITVGLEVMAGFFLALKLLPASASSAAWLTLAFPILTSRLLYAMWSTLAGHALDLVVIVAALWTLQNPDDRRRPKWLFLASTATFLTYVSSLFNTSAFLVVLALLAARLRFRLLVVWCGSALIVVVGLYGAFTVTFFKEILPALAAGAGDGQTAATLDPFSSGPLWGAFARIVSFSGFGFPLFALVGLLLIAKRPDPAATVLKAYALAFLGLVILRGLSRGVFRDLKELEYAGPAFGILSALTVQHINSRSARLLVLFGLVITGVWMQYGYFDRWSRLVLQ